MIADNVWTSSCADLSCTSMAPAADRRACTFFIRWLMQCSKAATMIREEENMSTRSVKTSAIHVGKIRHKLIFQLKEVPATADLLLKSPFENWSKNWLNAPLAVKSRSYHKPSMKSVQINECISRGSLRWKIWPKMNCRYRRKESFY